MKDLMKNLGKNWLLLMVCAIAVTLDYLLGGSGEFGGMVAFAVAAVNTNGSDGAGVHVNDDLKTDTVREVGSNLLKDAYDDDIVKMGFSTAPINAMTRDMGFKQIRSMRYGYYSVDLRVTEDSVKTSLTLTSTAVDREKPAIVQLEVNNEGVFDKTDQIIFSGIDGYNKDGVAMRGVCLAARVANVTTGKLELQFLNGKENVEIPAGTTIYILGHAASEIDASTVPYSALPTEKTQYMQKFMVQSLVSNVMIDSMKEVKWDKSDIDELVMQQFAEDIEKTYIFGVRSYTYDTTTRLYTYTCSGIIEQLVDGGGVVKDITVGGAAGSGNEFSYAKILDLMNELFIGNSGSNTRYCFMGSGFATEFFKIPEIVKYQNVNDTEHKFEFDFRKIKLMNYTLLCLSHPLLDKLGHTDCALIIDRQYLQKRVFYTVGQTELKLKETGAYDGKSTVWSEISSPILKYPQCHGFVTMKRV